MESRPSRRRRLPSGGHCLALALGLPLAVAVTAARAPAPVLDLGSRRELFVDTTLVEKLSGLAVKLHEPRPAGTALEYDGPTEDKYCFYTTVIKDGDTYRMYYRGRIAPKEQASQDVHLKAQTTCYAESRDGITWTRPSLGLVEINGSRDNNVILETYAHNFAPFLDTRPGVPASERYKANIAQAVAQPEHHLDLVGYVSADGIRWRLVREQALVPSAFVDNFDCQNPMFWSEAEGCYVLYARHFVGGRRATARATSPDFLNWSTQTLMTYGDTGTTVPSMDLYTNQTTPYFRAPHIYISLPGRFHPKRRALTEAQARALAVPPYSLEWIASDVSDGVFLTSRAGTTRYDFLFRESFVRPGIGTSNWTSRTNYPALGIVPTGPAEMSIYVQRDYAQASAHLERLTLRTDGFTSVHAPYDGGEMITRPFRFTGKELEVNVATGAGGGMRVEIQGEDGAPLPGRALADCPEIVGDEIERVVAWKSGSDLAALAGRPVRLRFALRDADLYSIRFR